MVVCPKGLSSTSSVPLRLMGRTMTMDMKQMIIMYTIMCDWKDR